MKKYLILFCFITTVIFFGCGKGKISVTLAGSTAFQPFAEKIADEYMKANPNITITVQGGGSAVGIQSANSGAAQIGMADLVKLPDEAKGLTSTVVAQDGIAVIVNPKNKIINLGTEQLRDVFNGKINNWKEIGGMDAPITVVSREAGSGTRSSFEKILTDIRLVNNAVIQNSNGTIRETVANDENSIGYISHGILNEKVKGLKIDNVECTTESIIAKNYKLVRPIFLLTKGAPAGEVKKFIDYILTEEIQLMIKKDGLLPAK
jgi:phosphate transport system substrate-binding protein